MLDDGNKDEDSAETVSNLADLSPQQIAELIRQKIFGADGESGTSFASFARVSGQLLLGAKPKGMDYLSLETRNGEIRSLFLCDPVNQEGAFRVTAERVQSVQRAAVPGL